MRIHIIGMALLITAILPGQAFAVCDWTIDKTLQNNTPDAVYSTINDLGDPSEDGNDPGHTTHPCGRLHWDGAASMYGTVASWPSWAASPDYVNFIVKVLDENNTVLVSSTKTVFYPSTGNSASFAITEQLLNGSYNYTVTGYSYFIDVIGANDFVDANKTVLWDSELNAEGPTVVWNNPLQGDSESEIISASVEATDANYNIFDVNGAVMEATNTADPGQGNFSGPSVSASGWTPNGGDTWVKTIDLTSDGDSEWDSGGHPIYGQQYKICAWARNAPLQQSPTTCVNFTFISAGGPPTGNGTLRGTVFANETGVPTGLTGVLVTLPSIGWATTTTIFGHFTFTEVPIDNYTIRFQKSGYVTKEIFQEWDHTDNDTFTGLILLEPSDVTPLFEPLTDEEIQLALRTYIPFLFFLAVGAFATIIVVETIDSIAGPRRYRRRY
jgi:hypothetical protein